MLATQSEKYTRNGHPYCARQVAVTGIATDGEGLCR